MKPAPTPTVSGVVGRYKELLAGLDAALREDTDRARSILMDVFGPIKLVAEGQGVWAEIENRTDRLLLAAGAATPSMVAGAGFCNWKHRILLKSAPEPKPEKKPHGRPRKDGTKPEWWKMRDKYVTKRVR